MSKSNAVGLRGNNAVLRLCTTSSGEISEFGVGQKQPSLARYLNNRVFGRHRLCGIQG